MRPGWWCFRAGLRREWRGLALLTLITALTGAVALTALAGARRTDTAVARFLRYAGPFQGQVAAGPATMDKIAALPSVAYTERDALMLAVPVSADGRPVPDQRQSQVLTLAVVYRPPQARAIILAGRFPVQSRADEVALNESAARELRAHAGSVLEMRGYRPDQMKQVLNGTVIPPKVTLGRVLVTGILRLPTDLTANFDADAGVSYTGQGDIIATAAFYQRHAASVGNFPGISFQLKRGAAGAVTGDHQRTDAARQRRRDDSRRRGRGEPVAPGAQRVPRGLAESGQPRRHQQPETAVPRHRSARRPSAGGP